MEDDRLSDTESLVDEIVTYLEKNWDGEVTSVNNAEKDDVKLEPLAATFIGEPPPSIATYPALVILTDFNEAEIWKQTSEQWGFTLSVGIIVAIGELNIEKLQRMIWRYIDDVIWKLLKDAHFASSDTVGFNLGNVGTPRKDWGPILTNRKTSQYRQDARIILEGVTSA